MYGSRHPTGYIVALKGTIATADTIISPTKCQATYLHLNNMASRMSNLILAIIASSRSSRRMCQVT